MLKDYDISVFKKEKPPGDFTFDTMQEIKSLRKIPLNKKFAEEFDNIPLAFKKTAEKENIQNYDENLSQILINESYPKLIELKEYFNRPRPKDIAKKMNIDLPNHELKSMNTASYPSGHSAQGILIGLFLSDKYPQSRGAFLQTAKNISDSRNIARAHYKSDSDLGKKIGASMYNHIKKK